MIKKGSTTLLEEVISGKLDYTIADSVAISLFQRVHPSWPWRWMSRMNSP